MLVLLYWAGMFLGIVIEPSILELESRCTDLMNEAVLGQIMAAVFLDMAVKDTIFTMKSLILAQDER